LQTSYPAMGLFVKSRKLPQDLCTGCALYPVAPVSRLVGH
jgi:hypothetical protein